MSYTDIERPIYYPEEYDYSVYYQNEFNNYSEPKFAPSKSNSKKPTINYLNERKCPIYIHHMRNDSSVVNNYNQKLATPRKKFDSPKVTPQNASKFVLDKLEETYWATWKPKKANSPKASPRKVLDFGFPDAKPMFRVHNKGSKKTLNRPHGDVNDNIIKYFKANNFETSSTTGSLNQEEGIKKTLASSTSPSAVQEESKHKKSSTTTVSIVQEALNSKNSSRKLTKTSRFGKLTEKASVSQEIQTEVHCPIILESKNMHVILEREEETHEKNLKTTEEVNEEYSRKSKEEKRNKHEGKNSKKDEKKKKNLKNKKTKAENKTKLPKELPTLTETETEHNSDSLNTFVDHKDSIEITKHKKESEPKEHYQQPKCIRLYRKSTGTSGYIKGGTYPLKSCLKKDTFPKGNFKLGAPGSPLFITTSSFSNRKKK